MASVLITSVECSVLPLCRLHIFMKDKIFNTLRTGDEDLRFYVTTVQDG